MDTPNTYKLLQEVLRKIYDLEERVEKLEKDEPRLFASDGDTSDPLYESVKALVIQKGEASASLLQRRLRIGFARAARFLDLLESDGIIGPADGAKPRDVIVGELSTQFPLELLEYQMDKANAGDVNKNVAIIEKTLCESGIDVIMDKVNIGPTVTQYNLKLAEEVNLSKIKKMVSKLSLALKISPIRIDTSSSIIDYVNIEVPNKVRALVSLRELIEDESFQRSNSNLTFTIGRNVGGMPVTADLKLTPHFLMAGETGSGKSVFINSIILSLLSQNSSDDLRLILIDPKHIGFTKYNDIPHLLVPVILDADKAISILRWSVDEMNRRFGLLAEASCRNIEHYNERQPKNKLPRIVICIDELSDLMVKSHEKSEALIVRLAQMSRATGIHLIMATSRPSAEVITSLIKTNILNRIAFTTASKVDSKRIIDTDDAENLLKNGDMLYRSGITCILQRIQGPLVTDEEIKRVAGFLKTKINAEYYDSIASFKSSDDVNIDDDLYCKAKEVVIRTRRASSEFLQRELRIGYARAARLIDLMESNGVIGPADGAKPRDVLVKE